MAVRPVVDEVEREWKGRLSVIRIDLQDEAGAVLGREMGVLYTPTFLLFDAAGGRVFRSIGRLDPAEIRRTLRP
jgi:thiol-disulfide isomerase/thioredoxin